MMMKSIWQTALCVREWKNTIAPNNTWITPVFKYGAQTWKDITQNMEKYKKVPKSQGTRNVMDYIGRPQAKFTEKSKNQNQNGYNEIYVRCKIKKKDLKLTPVGPKTRKTRKQLTLPQETRETPCDRNDGGNRGQVLIQIFSLMKRG